MKTFDRIELLTSPEGAVAIRRAVHRAYVGAVYSDANNAAFSSVKLPDDAFTLSMTNKNTLQALNALIDLAIEHHGTVKSIAIVGYLDELAADAFLMDCGYERVSGNAGLEYQRMGEAAPEQSA